jgi:hypothetical protein
MKTLPEGKNRELQKQQGFHEKEIKVYRDIFNLIIRDHSDENSAWCPKFVYSKDDALVLEDLSVRNYKMMPFGFKFKQNHVEESLKMLARFHACSLVDSLNNPQNNIGERYRKLLVSQSFVVTNPWLQNGFRAITRLAADQHFDLKSLTRKLNETFDLINNPKADHIKTLVHGDLWKNNLMFKFEGNCLDNPTHCVLLDFQLVTWLPFQIDVLLLIVLNTERRHCEEFFDFYLKFYYKHLEEELKKYGEDLKALMSFDSFTKSCEYFKHFAFVYNALATMITQIKPERLSKLSEEDYKAFIIFDRYSIVKKLMNEDQIYRKLVTESIEVLVEFFKSQEIR